MGEIIGAAVVSHVPPIVMSEEERKKLNDGQDFSLVEGLNRLRSERLDMLNPETVVVIDTHWFTTVEHIITSHDRRKGIFTSDELPRGMSQVSYDMPGDSELAFELEKQLQVEKIREYLPAVTSAGSLPDNKLTEFSTKKIGFQ